MMKCTLLLLSLLLSGCVLLYVPEIHQGNIVSQDRFELVEVGMTKTQVIAILGTPLIQDAFHSNRFDYLYRYNNQNSHVIILFDKDERVISIDGTSSHPNQKHTNEIIAVPEQ